MALEDLTLEEKEEIAEQWQDALEVSTGTELTPGLIAPVGTPLSGGRTQISWPEVVDKIRRNLGLTDLETLPSTPTGGGPPGTKGVTAGDFYRTGIQTGFLPSGATTFQQSPFGTFAGRMDVAAGQAPAATQEAIESAAEGQQQVISGFRRPLEQADLQTDDWSEGAGSMAMAGGGGILALLGGVTGAVTSMLQGTPFHDFTHMLGRSSGGTAHNTQGFNREYVDPVSGEVTTVNMNETLWRAWDNLDKGQQKLLANREKMMYQDENGHWTATTGKQRKKEGDEKDSMLKPGDKGYDKLSLIDRFFGWGRASSKSMEPKLLAERGSVRSDRPGSALIDTGYSAHQRWEPATRKQMIDLDNYVENSYDYATGQSAINTDKYVQQTYGGYDATWGTGFGRRRGVHGGDYSYKGDEEKGTTGTERIEGAYNPETDKYEGNKGVMFGPDVPANWPTQEEVIGSLEMDKGPEQAAAAESIGEDWYLQEGGPIPAMPQPQGGAPGEDVANLGVINEQAVQPQQGGQKSVKDDVPRKADEGDYILPYETVLMVGLKQLNRYAREAIKLAMKNDINLAGTDLDPTDDVPIKVSNYEYHIPKTLVPFFGGGKKYLDKIREEGLALRKRLEEEKQPSAQEQQAQPAPPQMAPPQAGPPQAGPPQIPMMRKGGFVPDPNEGQQQQTPTTAAVLEGDTSQQTTAYNQLKALQHSKKTQQQPPMVDPTGKVIPQGFAAPQGYDAGGNVISEEDKEDAKEMNKGGDTFEGVVPGEKPGIEERDYFKTAQKRMKVFHRLEPAQKLAMVAMLEGRGGIPGSSKKEKQLGMRAIMHVVDNRRLSNSPEFIDGSVEGSTLEKVLMKPLAFTALSALNKDHPYKNPKSKQYNLDKYHNEVENLASSFDKIRVNDENWKQTYADAQAILAGKLPDITGGALFYYNPKKMDMPKHLKNKSFLTAIGGHNFHNSGGFVTKVMDTAA